MENEPIKKQRKSVPKLERIPLSKSALEKIDAHIEQIEAKREGVFLTRKLYVEQILESLPEALSNSDCSKLAEKFFDEEKFLKFLMNKVKESKKSGEAFEMAKYLEKGLSKPKAKTKKQKKFAGNSTDSPTPLPDQNQEGKAIENDSI